MGLTENLVEIKSQTDALLEFANETTGASDVRLGDAVRTLVDGYGSSGGYSIIEGSFTIEQESNAYSVPCSKSESDRFIAFLYPIDVRFESTFSTMSQIISYGYGQTDFSRGGTRTDYSVYNNPFNMFFGSGYATNAYTSTAATTSTAKSNSMLIQDGAVVFGRQGITSAGGKLSPGTYGYIIVIG